MRRDIGSSLRISLQWRVTTYDDWHCNSDCTQAVQRVQTWQKGANLAEGRKPGRRVQTWQKGANLAEGCKPGRKWVSPLHLCTFYPSSDASRRSHMKSFPSLQRALAAVLAVALVGAV